MSTAKRGTLLLGLGNPLRGDDGAGPAVIEWVRERGLPAGVTAIDAGTPGLDLVLTLADYDRAVIVDAAGLGRAPGSWARFTSERLLEDNGSGLTLHAAGLADALRLGAALDQLPDHLVIFGVQPAQVDWSPGLSAGVAAAVPEVGRAVLNELGSQDGEDSDH